MEPDILLPLSQEPASSPFLQPDESNEHLACIPFQKVWLITRLFMSNEIL